ncbi:hypothetical protein Zmor_006343 [Zophobas morio]|uniref:Tc1-like transposase DDE domain-containing protein n=1 Tax=Zophobas morio TaxID=2755281 RepID=A0AA38MNG1_9CUCU|nr:hypothetical protein Zmor_023776 [Zophobas morio]KAJ3661972.1 hypothetical protein Zmor_006343 [Zophobas morio]
MCLPNLPPNCVFVLDNASYHTVKIEKEPTSVTKKLDMQQWLRSKDIEYDPGMTKPELYTLIKENKNKNPKFRVDQILEEHGHTVLRLPPYHPELNPIEKIWALVKNYVAQRNVTFKMSEVKTLAENKFKEITANEWWPICEHVKKVEKEYFIKENIVDDTFDNSNLNFVVNTASSDESESDDGDDLGYSLFYDSDCDY